MRSIKEIERIRILAKPYLDWKKRKHHEIYLCTPDHFYLKTLKGIHEGQRCFIIGNGPSLRAADLDMLKTEYTFAANWIFKIFDQTNWRPTYYLCVDEKVLLAAQNEFFNYNLGHMFLRYGVCNLIAPTNKITKIYIEDIQFDPFKNKAYDTTKYISEDVSDHLCDGITVTFEAIQLAIFMGFKEIYLIGVDHNYSHVTDLSGNIQVDTTVKNHFGCEKFNPKTDYPANLNTSQYSYTIAKEYCDTHGIKIYNATRGGKLEVFKRVDFDKLFL